MVKRQEKVVSYRVYAAAFTITVIIFALGVFIGITLENERVNRMQSDFEQYTADLESLSLQYALLEKGDYTCELYPEMFSELYLSMDKIGEKLEKYETEKNFFDTEFDMLKSRYTTLTTRTWVLLEKVKEKCKGEFTTIIYFYSSKECNDCEAQGVVLDYFKKTYGMRSMIFPVDIDYTHPSVHALKTLYNVTTVPTTLIDSKIKVEGLSEKEELLSLLCNSTDLCE